MQLLSRRATCRPGLSLGLVSLLVVSLVAIKLIMGSFSICFNTGSWLQTQLALSSRDRGRPLREGGGARDNAGVIVGGWGGARGQGEVYVAFHHREAYRGRSLPLDGRGRAVVNLPILRQKRKTKVMSTADLVSP